MKNEKALSLTSFIEQLQSQGRYSFPKNEAISCLKISSDAFKLAARRLVNKKRLIGLRQNFYVIVPFEYRTLGSPPASWYIDDLMKYLKIPYYIGLLTAAAIYGAAHQQPMVFQVVCAKTIRSISFDSIAIDFVFNKLLEKMPVEKVQTPTGYMNVSTPEATAFDLIKYLPLVGHINNVVTVLIELKEKLREEKIVEIAHNVASIRSIQRLGYILDYIHSGINTELLAQLILEKKAQYIPLIARRKTSGGGVAAQKNKNKRWKILINETIEPDLDL